MFHIRHNIIFSVMAHSILLAAALHIGGSSEVRKASLFTVSLFDEKENSSLEKQAAIAVVKLNTHPMVTPTTAKAVTKLSAAQEIIPKQSSVLLAPLEPQTDTGIDAAPGVPGIEVQNPSSLIGESASSSVSSQTFRSNSGEADATSALRGHTGQATETVADASLKQRIHNALQANLIYPYIARKRRIEGTVLLEFRINGRGMPEGVRIVKGSSYSILDEAARETVFKTSPFPAIDNIIEVPIRFSLRGD